MTLEVQTTVRGSAYIRESARRGGPGRSRSRRPFAPRGAEGRRDEMATYRDPVRIFAPLEIVERLLEIRADAGYTPMIFLRSSDDLVAYFDAYGFDVYSFDDAEAEFRSGGYGAPPPPGAAHAPASP